MFENILNIFKKMNKKNGQVENKTNKDEAKERLHLVLMQDRANVSADFLDLMRQEIIDVIKKYIDVDEKDIDVRLTNKQNSDGTTGAPALYANIPIKSIKNETKNLVNDNQKENNKQENNKEKQEGKEELVDQDKAQIENKEQNNKKETEEKDNKESSINNNNKEEVKSNNDKKDNVKADKKKAKEKKTIKKK